MKQRHWINEALEDLEFFAAGNRLPKIATKIREARETAWVELRPKIKGSRFQK